MKKSIISLLLQFSCIFLFCSLGIASSARVEGDEWLHPSTAPEKRRAVQALVQHFASLNKCDLNNFVSHPRILQAGKHTAYAKVQEVAFWALAREYVAAFSGIKIVIWEAD